MQQRSPSWDEIIHRYGLIPSGPGGQFRGPCPIHGGHNPTAFVLSPERGFFCHACGQGGGIATFVRLMEGGIPSAQDAHRPPDRRGVVSVPPRLDLDRLARERQRVLAILPEVDPVCPRDPTHSYFRTRGMSPATVAALGGGVFLGPGPFHRRAVFPVWTPEGKLVGHVGRAIDVGAVPRYLCQQGFRKGLLLYNERAPVGSDPVSGIPRNPFADPVIVTEGIFDAAAVLESGVPNVVALIGCMASTFQLAALSRYRRVIALLDGDEAGREGARLLTRVLGRRVSVVDLASGDPGSVGTSQLAASLSTFLPVHRASSTLP